MASPYGRSCIHSLKARLPGKSANNQYSTGVSNHQSNSRECSGKYSRICCWQDSIEIINNPHGAFERCQTNARPVKALEGSLALPATVRAYPMDSIRKDTETRPILFISNGRDRPAGLSARGARIARARTLIQPRRSAPV